MSYTVGQTFKHASLGNVRVVEYFGLADVTRACPVNEGLPHYAPRTKPSGLYFVPA